jgi:hypothetical protein
MHPRTKLKTHVQPVYKPLVPPGRLAGQKENGSRSTQAAYGFRELE